MGEIDNINEILILKSFHKKTQIAICYWQITKRIKELKLTWHTT